MKTSHFALAGLFLLLAAGIYLTMKTEMDGRLDDMKAENEQKFERYEKAQREQAALQKEQAALIAKNADALKGSEKPEPEAAATPSKTGIRKTTSAVVEDIKTLPARRPAAPEIADAPPQDLLPPVPGSTADPTEMEIREKERNILNNPGIANERMDIETGTITRAIPEGDRLTRTQARVMAQPAIARVKETSKEANEFVVLDRGENANLAKGDKFSVRRGTFILGTIAIGDTVRPTESVADITSLIDGASLQKGDEIIRWTATVQK